MTCQHMNRSVINSRPRRIAGLRSTYRASDCKDCGHRWYSYELSRDQLVELVEQAKGAFLEEMQQAIDRHQCQSTRSTVLGWFDEAADG